MKALLGLTVVFFAVVLAIVGWMKNLTNQLKNEKSESLPLFYNFTGEILPTLSLYWLAFANASLAGAVNLFIMGSLLFHLRRKEARLRG